MEIMHSKDEVKLMEIIQLMEDGKIVSLLGGKPEGVVIKNYTQCTPIGFPATVKLVRDEFKERSQSSREPEEKVETLDQLGKVLGQMYCTTGRFQKAVQHLKERNILQGNLTDLKMITSELDSDLWKEAKEDITTAMMGYLFSKIASNARL